MITNLPPGVIMILAAFAVPWVPHHFRQVYMLGIIALSALGLMAGEGIHLTLSLMDLDLILHRSDNLSLPFAIVFHLAAGLNVIYGWHERKSLEHTAGLAYAGAAIAALHAGDLISLFIWWEATAITSVFLILAGQSQYAQSAAMRYLLVQVLSGVLLLAGATLLWRETGSLGFDAIRLESLGAWLIFIAFGIKAAFPFLNGWLQDSYPEASALGTVILSAFTTKLAIYALARSFAGVEYLIYIGALMTIFPVFFAVIENNLRRVLAFSLNNQLGFMTVGIGIGSEMAVNGAVAHAFAHIIYKALLFMSMGAVLHRVGTTKASELGGLYKSMPLTMIFCIIGAVSISAFPLFSGYVAKSLITSALGYEGLILIYIVLLAASAGVLEHSGIKIPYFTFFAHDAGHKVKEAPLNMLIAMTIASVLCIAIGVMPQLYYQLLPYEISYNPYDASHVIGQMQLLIFAALAFVFLMWAKIYPPEIPSVVLNSDWFYRRLAPAIVKPILRAGFALGAWGDRVLIAFSKSLIQSAKRLGEHPIAGPVIPGPAAIVQLGLLVLMVAVIYLALR